MLYSPQAEWLEAAGTGAFAMGPVSRIRTRRYHTLLMHADSPSSSRRVLVCGFDAWLECRGERLPLSRQRYSRNVVGPADAVTPSAFEHRPWPTWIFEAAGGTWREEIFISSMSGETILRWKGSNLPADSRFFLRPFLACRDYHAMQSRDDKFRFGPEKTGARLVWRPYPGQPGFAAFSNAVYRHEPFWYERFEYETDRARGFESTEDLASPGVFSWTLGAELPWPVLILRSLAANASDPGAVGDAADYATGLADAERVRRDAMTPLEFSASQYLVRRNGGASIIAGYPWFTDWGRDTFVALRGLFISQGKLDEARAVVETWAAAIDDGLLPNCFCDDADPNYAAADTSLWFIVAAAELIAAMRKSKRGNQTFARAIGDATDSILNRFIRGTRYGVRADDDGLLAAGEPGLALTWMDARVRGKPVTPRIGKPVELECLWMNALETARRRSPDFDRILKTARRSFVKRFWNAKRGYLADVVDAGHVPGNEDATLRPNQIFAVGGLPKALVPKRIAQKVVEAVAHELYTPLGLRTLGPRDPAYCGRYAGGPEERDACYHQGTAWPWLMGAFGEAWLRVNGDTPENRAWVTQNCLDPLRDNLDVAGLGHLSEIFDGDFPHAPEGCPFQAWSLGEFMRLERLCTEPQLSRKKLHAVS